VSDPDAGAIERPADLAAAGLGQHRLDELLSTVVALGRVAVSNADGVSVSLAVEGGYLTIGASDDVVRELDAVQYRYRSGPCVEAMGTGHQVAMALADDGDRYPGFTTAALQRFITGVLSTPLSADGGVLGALNCYSASVDRFPARDVDVIVHVARHAAALLAAEARVVTATTTNDQLQQALLSRDLIGQAKGILMERRRCSADDAFDVLRRASQQANRKLTSVAADVVLAQTTDRLH
jgi:GAF domain-containing protein